MDVGVPFLAGAYLDGTRREIQNASGDTSPGAFLFSPDISWDFYCRRAIGHVYCVALVQSPRHIVLYAVVALTARALYPRPLARTRYETP